MAVINTISLRGSFEHNLDAIRERVGAAELLGLPLRIEMVPEGDDLSWNIEVLTPDNAQSDPKSRSRAAAPTAPARTRTRKRGQRPVPAGARVYPPGHEKAGQRIPGRVPKPKPVAAVSRPVAASSSENGTTTETLTIDGIRHPLTCAFVESRRELLRQGMSADQATKSAMACDCGSTRASSTNGSARRAPTGRPGLDVA